MIKRNCFDFKNSVMNVVLFLLNSTQPIAKFSYRAICIRTYVTYKQNNLLTRWRGPSPRHCARATRLLSRKCRSGSEPSATLFPIWPVRDLNLGPPSPEANALPLDQLDGYRVDILRKIFKKFKLYKTNLQIRYSSRDYDAKKITFVWKRKWIIWLNSYKQNIFKINVFLGFCYAFCLLLRFIDVRCECMFCSKTPIGHFPAISSIALCLLKHFCIFLKVYSYSSRHKIYYLLNRIVRFWKTRKYSLKKYACFYSWKIFVFTVELVKTESLLYIGR